MPIFPIPTSENLPKPLHFATALNALILFFASIITYHEIECKTQILCAHVDLHKNNNTSSTPSSSHWIYAAFERVANSNILSYT